jgi:curli biogenesis system outer membrane secretion channel CsgG
MTRPFLTATFLTATIVNSLLAQRTPSVHDIFYQSATAQAGSPKTAAPPGVDTVIALVKGGMSESLVIRTIQRENKPYTLSAADLLKLQKAGVTETIINAMMDPKASGPAIAPAAATSAAVVSPKEVLNAAPSTSSTISTQSTPYPPSLDSATGVRKRRLAVQPFDYSTVRSWVTFWFNSDVNIGQGIRAMLTARMHQSKNITLLERTNLDTILAEQNLGSSGRVNQGTKAKVGRISGADCILFGDIVIFGRDDTTKHKGIGAAIGGFGGGLLTMNKEEKAVVGINLRIVDAESGEVIETAEARGESSRKSKNWGALLGGKGNGAGAASDMTSSNFAETIIGEATSNAVDKILVFLEGRIPQLPLKARSVEGRVANITASSIYLTVGADDGVMPGDRFDILQIKNEVIDPATRQVLDVEVEKVGEMVIDTVREKVASGHYGGLALSTAYAKGYAARLTSK